MTLFCRNGRSDSLVLEGRLRGSECVAITVADGPHSLVLAQVRAGLLVRMAVLRELVSGAARLQEVA